MGISFRAEYALRAVFELSSRSPDQPATISDIAERQGIPRKFLELILADLKQGRFVESRRGAEGGYLLTRAPEFIKVGEVIRFFDSARDQKSRVRRRAESPFSEVWRRVNQAVSDVLDQTSFADLQRDFEEKRTRFVPNWDI